MIAGYEISCDEILRVAAEQREREQGMFEDMGMGSTARAAAVEVKALKSAGRFSFDPATGNVTGPSEYMAERYDARMEQINAGRDSVANMAISMHGDVVLAVLVSLQTDYAAWAGMRSFQGARR
jgi:hypothetical protein